MSTSETAGGLEADLREARQRLADTEAAVAEYGEADIERVHNALRRADRLLNRYEGSATGTGDFQAYVEFQSEFADLAEDLPEDLPARDAFESANEVVDQRRLSESDFATARERLAPARDLADLLSDREAAREEVREAKRAVRSRITDLDEKITERERVLDLGEAFDSAEMDDADARIANLRETVETYDEAVRQEFAAFRREASARELLEFVDDTGYYPLVGFGTPPDELVEYVERHEVGENPLPDLLEYADYSTSKLDHYVDDVDAFRTRVPIHRTYLDRLSADPLTVGWPAPEAGELRMLADELVSVVAKFAAEGVVADTRALRRIAMRDDYDRLHRIAVAETDLTDEKREKLESGAIFEELEAAQDERDRLREALAESG